MVTLFVLTCLKCTDTFITLLRRSKFSSVIYCKCLHIWYSLINYQDFIKYEDESKIFRTFMILIYLHKHKGKRNTSFFYIIPILFDALVPSVHKLVNSIWEEFFWVVIQPFMHRFLHSSIWRKFMTSQSIFEWSEEMIVGRRKFLAVCRMLYHFKTQFINGFNSFSGRMWARLGGRSPDVYACALS